ncbi:CPBP family glutamic-type intramembrane protease [Paracoccus ravus]|uniref:CPBP family glutamic-type intramembrane protease n=1 Tax=Paracoccus ravus TaxID=2447760 RepID=UPI00106E738F|nr:CPBP family glutamic-type intramembrane protease [Paracoccus ravus]
MDRRLALAAVLAIPVLSAIFALIAASGLRPLSGALLGMSFYWLLLAAALWNRGGWSLCPRWPGGRLALAFGGTALFLAWTGLPGLAALSPHVAALAIIAGLSNGCLEEAFWRGALVPRLGRRHWRAGIAPVLLFALWHVAPAMLLRRLDLPGGAVIMALAALFFGALAMTLRLASGSAGLGAILHVLASISVFAHAAAINGTSRFP